MSWLPLISKESICRSVAQLSAKRPHVETKDAPPTSRPSSSSALLPMSLSLTSWSCSSTCVLILIVVLTIYLMRCIRWTLESIASLAASLALVVLHPYLHSSLLRSSLLVEMMMMMMLIVLALLVMMRWRPLNDAPFVTCDKKGE